MRPLCSAFPTIPHLVLLMIIGVLYVLGMFMETLATIIILVPVLLPMILQLGIDPIHFGIVLVVTNNVAMLTPPLGVNLFVASRIAGISVERISVAVIPYLIALTLCILLFTYVPAISTCCPALWGTGSSPGGGASLRFRPASPPGGFFSIIVTTYDFLLFGM